MGAGEGPQDREPLGEKGGAESWAGCRHRLQRDEGEGGVGEGLGAFLAEDPQDLCEVGGEPLVELGGRARGLEKRRGVKIVITECWGVTGVQGHPRVHGHVSLQQNP